MARCFPILFLSWGHGCKFLHWMADTVPRRCRARRYAFLVQVLAPAVGAWCRIISPARCRRVWPRNFTQVLEIFFLSSTHAREIDGVTARAIIATGRDTDCAELQRPPIGTDVAVIVRARWHARPTRSTFNTEAVLVLVGHPVCTDLCITRSNIVHWSLTNALTNFSPQTGAGRREIEVATRRRQPWESNLAESLKSELLLHTCGVQIESCITRSVIRCVCVTNRPTQDPHSRAFT